MTRSDPVITRLLAQAHESGADLTSLRALIEEASELGAERALEILGLADKRAGQDMAELRQLLGAWRDAKRSARQAVINWLVRLAGAGLLLMLAIRLNLIELLQK